MKEIPNKCLIVLDRIDPDSLGKLYDMIKVGSEKERWIERMRSGHEQYCVLENFEYYAINTLNRKYMGHCYLEWYKRKGLSNTVYLSQLLSVEIKQGWII